MKAAMSREARLIARATARAYASALAEGADARVAFETACALYRHGHPRVRDNVLRRVVTALVRHPPDGAQAEGAQARAKSRGVIAAQNAYVRAIASGAKPDIAFDVARAAYRALYPGLSGAVLDSAVARALASRSSPAEPDRPEPPAVPAAATGPEVPGGPEIPTAPQT
jgi:hypothetical protein